MTFLTSSVDVHSLVNVAEYSPGAVFGPRELTSFEFVWVLTGSAVWTVLDPSGSARETHRLAPGTVALSPNRGSDRYEWDNARPSTHAFVHFDLPAGTDPSRWPRTRSFADCPPLDALANGLFQIDAADRRTATRRSSQLVGLMLELFLAEPSRAPNDPLSRTTAEAMAYVSSVWSSTGVRIVGIAEIATAIRISSGHLSRSFHDDFGIGLAGALELVRLARAAVALQRTTTTLSRIAAECGFTDEYHLSRRFSLRYGTPPGAYRRTRREAEPLAPIIERRLMTVWTSLLPGFPTKAGSEVGGR